MSSADYRKKGLEAHGDQCAVCGADEDVIHHRDGDRGNNEVPNLIPLCHTCHRKVHTAEAVNATAAKLIRELGKRPISNPGSVYIEMSDELADVLHDRKDRGDSYEDVIWRLLDEGDAE